ncbi:unnamed protein product [Phytophthora fragariaefolia]|uniref:Unnamed protein product n=1 Tax=Phytophthora fragariaefolia TaxID=1490495 RepID=A0A9W6YAB1_9STRA|nr:unnamed protein product [Phytophthora fragariaefolia]
MRVFRFAVVAAIAAIAIDTAVCEPEASSKTAEEVSDNAQDVILGASSKTGSVAAGAANSTSGSNSAPSAVITGIATTAISMTAAWLL